MEIPLDHSVNNEVIEEKRLSIRLKFRNMG